MWVVAVVLLGLFALLVLLGLRAGPHSHLAGALFGAAAAAWLLAMALSGHGETLVWTLFGVDLGASLGIALAAREALRRPAAQNHPLGTLTGREGIAVSDLNPEGVVRVGGEDWSAISMNGPIARGGRVQVVEREGVRIGVWGIEAPADQIDSGEQPETRKAGM